MPDWPTRDRRWEWDRRSFEDRRQPPERRGDGGRKGSGGTAGAGPDAVRSYVFRSFSVRRRGDDRRTLPDADRRAGVDPRHKDGTVDLSPEEILVLLHRPEE
jgi:hypothetical protein